MLLSVLAKSVSSPQIFEFWKQPRAHVTTTSIQHHELQKQWAHHDHPFSTSLHNMLAIFMNRAPSAARPSHFQKFPEMEKPWTWGLSYDTLVSVIFTIAPPPCWWDTPQKCHFTLRFCMLHFLIAGCPCQRHLIAIYPSSGTGPYFQCPLTSELRG
jgi:hypothetical protein